MGRDPDKKFVVLHHSILSEGINVHGLEAVLFMRSMDYITISQTIGRVIRKGDADKVFGLVCVPVYSNVGITTARKVEAVVDTIFNKGQAAQHYYTMSRIVLVTGGFDPYTYRSYLILQKMQKNYTQRHHYV